MAEGFKYDVFLSHSAKDKAVVRLLAERLGEDPIKSSLAQFRVTVLLHT